MQNLLIYSLFLALLSSVSPRGCYYFKEKDVTPMIEEILAVRHIIPLNNQDRRNCKIFTKKATLVLPGTGEVEGRKKICDAIMEMVPPGYSIKVNTLSATQLSPTRIFSVCQVFTIDPSGKTIAETRAKPTWIKIKGKWFVEHEIYSPIDL